MFKRKENTIPDIDLEVDPIEDKSEIIERPQQSFSFGDLTQTEKRATSLKSKYKLPEIDFLDKSSTKLNASELNKNRPDGVVYRKKFF